MSKIIGFVLLLLYSISFIICKILLSLKHLLVFASSFAGLFDGESKDHRLCTAITVAHVLGHRGGSQLILVKTKTGMCLC